MYNTTDLISITGTREWTVSAFRSDNSSVSVDSATRQLLQKSASLKKKHIRGSASIKTIFFLDVVPCSPVDVAEWGDKHSRNVGKLPYDYKAQQSGKVIFTLYFF
jgi:hypothetical protein